MEEIFLKYLFESDKLPSTSVVYSSWVSSLNIMATGNLADSITTLIQATTNSAYCMTW